MGCRLWGRIELDMTEATWQQRWQSHYNPCPLTSSDPLVFPGDPLIFPIPVTFLDSQTIFCFTESHQTPNTSALSSLLANNPAPYFTEKMEVPLL